MLRQSLFVTTLLLLCVARMAAAEPVRLIEFHIIEKSLSDALLSLARQAGVSIIFSGDSEFDSKTNSEYHGKFSTAAMLDKLLADTMLEAEFVHRDVIAIRPMQCILTKSCAGSTAVRSLDDLASNPQLEQMLVIGKQLTGSRIRRTELNGSAPVDIISSFDIELAGAQSVGDLLRNLPAVVGNSTSTSISNGGDGTASVTLRGLPPTNTLVLLNGRRVANDGLAGESFDLNSLAPSSIDRIEVLKSGSSAVYGSDAIAGVINIILKKEFEGFQLDAYTGQSGASDLETKTTSFALGRVFNRASFFVSGTLFDQNGIFSRDRAISESADTRRLGGIDKRSSATPNSRITVPGSGALTLDAPPAAGQSSEDFRPVTDNDLFDFAQFTSSIVPSQRKSIYANLSLDLSDSTAAYIDLGYTSNKSDSMLAPTPLFTGFEAIPLTVSASNIFNPFGTNISDVRRRLVEFESRRQKNTAHSKRVAIGAEGNNRNVRWDASWHWSKSVANELLLNLVDAQNLQLALGDTAECISAISVACEPVDLFGPAGSVNQEQRDFIQTNASNSGFFKLYGAALNTEFTLVHLPAGRVGVAIGADYRKESTLLTPTDPQLITIGGVNFGRSGGERSVKELYYEATVPLIARTPTSQKLALELAGRYSDYSDFGETFNPRYALRFAPNSSVTFRASFAEGFRAPSLLELYKSDGESQAFLTDPCSIAANIGLLQGCQTQSDETRTQFLSVNGGNRNLLPEESEFAGAGVHWSPEQFQGLNMSLDFFQIKQTNVIDANAQFILDQNAQSGEFSSRVIRTDTGELERIIATNINIGRRSIKGLDFSAAYAAPLTGAGRLHFTLNASRLLNYKEQLNPSLDSEDILGTFVDEASEGRGSLPKWKANIGAYWKYKQWQANYTVHYIDSLQEFVSSTDSIRKISSWTTHDVQTSFLFLVADGLRLTLGVNNLFDREPPLVVSAFNDNIDPRTHDLIGRYWYLKLAQKF
ncbi:MAG: TonB-dependent receptor [Pseudomonadales bacterium]